jgi:hypothetical protein
MMNEEAIRTSVLPVRRSEFFCSLLHHLAVRGSLILKRE